MGCCQSVEPTVAKKTDRRTHASSQEATKKVGPTTEKAKPHGAIVRPVAEVDSDCCSPLPLSGSTQRPWDDNSSGWSCAMLSVGYHAGEPTEQERQDRISSKAIAAALQETLEVEDDEDDDVGGSEETSGNEEPLYDVSRTAMDTRIPLQAAQGPAHRRLGRNSACIPPVLDKTGAALGQQEVAARPDLGLLLLKTHHQQQRAANSKESRNSSSSNNHNATTGDEPDTTVLNLAELDLSSLNQHTTCGQESQSTPVDSNSKESIAVRDWATSVTTEDIVPLPSTSI